MVTQLRFARSEFVRCLEGVSDEDARRRIMPMNSLSWMVGHLAAQEQDHFAFFGQGEAPYPRLDELFGFGCPASTPPLDEMWRVWHDITTAADKYLDTITEDQLETTLVQSTALLEDAGFGFMDSKTMAKETVRAHENVGTRLLRTTYHYFYHTCSCQQIDDQSGFQLHGLTST
jgi:hypothetical protein